MSSNSLPETQRQRITLSTQEAHPSRPAFERGRKWLWAAMASMLLTLAIGSQTRPGRQLLQIVGFGLQVLWENAQPELSVSEKPELPAIQPQESPAPLPRLPHAGSQATLLQIQALLQEYIQDNEVEHRDNLRRRLMSLAESLPAQESLKVQEQLVDRDFLFLQSTVQSLVEERQYEDARNRIQEFQARFPGSGWRDELLSLEEWIQEQRQQANRHQELETACVGLGREMENPLGSPRRWIEDQRWARARTKRLRQRLWSLLRLPAGSRVIEARLEEVQILDGVGRGSCQFRLQVQGGREREFLSLTSWQLERGQWFLIW